MGTAYTVRAPEQAVGPLTFNGTLDTIRADAATPPANDPANGNVVIQVPDRAAVRIVPFTVSGGAAGTFTIWLGRPTSSSDTAVRFTKAATGATTVGTASATLTGITGTWLHSNVTITSRFLGNDDLIRVVGDIGQQAVMLDPGDSTIVVVQFKNANNMACGSSLISLGA